MSDVNSNSRLSRGMLIALAVILLTGFALRTNGLYRGLKDGYTFHPDESKQVHALHDYLNGKYTRYQNSLFFDGYPFFLNHFDEWIIRAISPAINMCRKHFTPDHKDSLHLEVHDLYYWARTLRVVYGMAVLLLCFAVARKMKFSNQLSLAAVSLLALAPLSIVVTHSAAGDIGVDLFLGATILMLCLHTQKPLGFFLFASGFFTGFAFAAKYHGAMGCLMIAMYCTFKLCTRQMCVKKYITGGLTAILGFIVAAHIAIPQMITAGGRTRSDIFNNFVFIKNYNLPKEFLEKPFLERAWIGFTKNTPYLISNLGPVLILLAAGGAVLITAKLYRDARAKKETGDIDSLTPLLASVFIYPFIAALLSLLGKGKIQAFHFSYTLFPFILAACYCVSRLWTMKRPYLKAAALLLIAAALTRSAAVSAHEDFFWRKDDTQKLSTTFADSVTRQTASSSSPYVNPNTTRNFDIENSNPSTFRNRDKSIVLSSYLFWNKIQTPPTPCVPFPYDSDWIFTEGPTFPRNDRMFIARHDRKTTKHIVMYTKPEKISVGIRTGSLPVILNISTGRKRHETRLEPDSQEIITLTVDKWRHNQPRVSKFKNDRDIYLVPLEIHPELGDAWITVLTSEQETRHYKAFGGDTDSFKSLLPPSESVENICAELSKARFLESNELITIRPSKNDTRTTIFPKGTVLPCGAYKLKLVLTKLQAPARLIIKPLDHRDLSQTFIPSKTFELSNDTTEISYSFQKPFSPHEFNIIAECEEGSAVIRHWSLMPDTETMVKDIQALTTGEAPAVWMQRFADAKSLTPRSDDGLRINLGKKYIIDKVLFPKKLEQGSDFKASVRIDINKRTRRSDIEESLLIFRIIPPSKATLPHIATPLKNTFYHSEWEPPLYLSLPEEIQPGTYDVVVGVLNVRTTKKPRMKGPVIPEGHKRRECWYNFGKLEVVPGK